jgi:thiamine kinase-like enzyme
LPETIDSVLEDMIWLSEEISPFRPALCHNDVLAANILDDGDRLWLVDWEYGGMGNPLFDLAGVCGNCGLEREEEVLLLSAYFGREDAAVAREVRILKAVSLLRETLWAVIQTIASDIDFDYVTYAAELFEAYSRARQDLN